MGGTFDPIHFGHLVSAEEAYFALGLSEVIFVPTGNPPHKKSKVVSSSEDRYTMTLLATLDNPHFKVSRLEIDRGGDSHTVDTLREMRHWYAPGSTELYFITGLDGVLDILSWKEPYAIVELCKIVAASRPGFNSSRIQDLQDPVRKAIIPLEIPLLAISSTEIRERVLEGKSTRYLLPWTVEHYIFKKNLYIRNGR
jgi:nicotinate-nucleotide adenylyltransferase